jgi:hypothetical protein
LPLAWLLSPKAHESPVLVTTAEWFFPPAPAVTVMFFNAATMVGTLRWRKSPCPSCPFCDTKRGHVEQI